MLGIREISTVRKALLQTDESPGQVGVLIGASCRTHAQVQRSGQRHEGGEPCGKLAMGPTQKREYGP